MIQLRKETNLRKRSEESTSGSRGDFGGIDRGNHESIADTNSGDKTTKHEEGVVW